MNQSASSASQAEKTFAFTKDNMQRAKQILARYPEAKKQSAVMPLLTLAQLQHDNWLPKEAMDYVAEMLDMPLMRVYEVATFYTMYNLKPVGKYTIEVCTTTPCWLRGSDVIVNACKETLGINIGDTTEDGRFTLKEAECLGACVNAPMCQIGEHYYEDLTPDSMRSIINDLTKDRTPRPGPQSSRKSSEPK